MTVPITKIQASGLLEASVWKRLRGAPHGPVYSASGPGPISTNEAIGMMAERGWFTTTADGWQITTAGEAAAQDVFAGRLGVL